MVSSAKLARTTNSVRVSMLNGDLVLETEVGQTTVHGLEDKIYELPG